jgi:hypothetical protein
MSFARIKPTGWSLNETLTSAQSTQLDLDHSNAADIRTGQTNTLLSASTINTPGSLTIGTGTLAIGASGTFTINASATCTLAIGATSSLTVTAPSTFSDLTMTSTNRVKLASRQKTKRMLGATFCSTSGWAIGVANVWTNSGTGALLQTQLDLKDGQVLDTVTVRYIGGAGHAAFPGGQPQFMPTVKVYKVDDTGASTQLGATATDSSASVATYEAAHDISVTAIAHTIDTSTNRYYVAIVAENGSNYLTGAVFVSCKAAVTFTAMPEW